MAEADLPLRCIVVRRLLSWRPLLSVRLPLQDRTTPSNPVGPKVPRSANSVARALSALTPDNFHVVSFALQEFTDGISDLYPESLPSFGVGQRGMESNAQNISPPSANANLRKVVNEGCP